MKLGRTILILFLLVTVNMAYSQEASISDKVTLKTGEVYRGEIIVKNNDILLIKLPSGSKFQFRIEEIKSIEKDTTPLPTDTDLKLTSDSIIDGNICGMFDFSGGVSNAPLAFSSSLQFDVSLAFGVKEAKHKSLFAGLGAGYSHILFDQTSVGFVPLFVRLGSNNLANHKNSPFFMLDLGYALNIDDAALYETGLFGKFFCGFIHQFNPKSAIFVGPSVSVLSISGLLSNTINGYSIAYNGNSVAYNFALRAGLLF